MVSHFNPDIKQYALLSHPFYQKWMVGEVHKGVLQEYAKQYYHHVNAFPRYVSRLHSMCHDIRDRQILLGNLRDEEEGDENHPELWLRFAEGLGLNRDEVINSEPISEIKALISGFFDSIRNSYAEGLGALHTYESQTPEVAKTKREGLKKFYSISDENALKFFTVHMSADDWHSEEVEGLISKLDSENMNMARKGAVKIAKLLNKFLDAMHVLNNAKFA